MKYLTGAQGRQFVRALLHPQPNNRMTTDDALSHEWPQEPVSGIVRQRTPIVSHQDGGQITARHVERLSPIIKNTSSDDCSDTSDRRLPKPKSTTGHRSSRMRRPLLPMPVCTPYPDSPTVLVETEPRVTRDPPVIVNKMEGDCVSFSQTTSSVANGRSQLGPALLLHELNAVRSKSPAFFETESETRRYTVDLRFFMYLTDTKIPSSRTSLRPWLPIAVATVALDDQPNNPRIAVSNQHSERHHGFL